MTHKSIKLPSGGYANGRTVSGNITLFISRNGAVYSCEVKNYSTQPEVTAAQLTGYCDEVCPLPNGGRLERRGAVIKIKQ